MRHVRTGCRVVKGWIGNYAVVLAVTLKEVCELDVVFRIALGMKYVSQRAVDFNSLEITVRIPLADCVQDISFATRRLKYAVVGLNVGSVEELLDDCWGCREKPRELFSDKLLFCDHDRVIAARGTEMWK